jgi:hypothetical protein
MPKSTYSVEQERRINTYVKKILEELGRTLPDDHYGTVEFSIPHQAGKISGRIKVTLASTFSPEGIAAKIK